MFWYSRKVQCTEYEYLKTSLQGQAVPDKLAVRKRCRDESRTSTRRYRVSPLPKVPTTLYYVDAQHQRKGETWRGTRLIRTSPCSRTLRASRIIREIEISTIKDSRSYLILLVSA